jgi:hypothetical protein
MARNYKADTRPIHVRNEKGVERLPTIPELNKRCSMIKL